LNVKAPVPGENEASFQFLAEHSVDIICRVGLDLVMHYASPSTYRVLGWKPEEMIGKVAKDFILAEDMPVLTAAIIRIFSPDVQTETATVRMRKKDGSTAWMEMNARLVRDSSSGEPREFVTVMRDITERKILEEQLSTLSLTDGLTGLSNRRAFDEALAREWNRTLREGSQISLLLLDIDHFKEFNDRYGHQVGDDCLRAVAASLKGAVRPTDVIARYGGEEIAVILPGTDTAGAVELAEKMRSGIEALCLTHEGRPEGGGHVTASIGAATALARHGGTILLPESLLLAADTAMYKAKAGGRNRVATALVVAPKTQ
jgi:diguanylate cyclase (GGDEF)-like protein/PAS domain S-box-containing protein